MKPAETITAIQSIGLELTAAGDRLHLSAGPVAPSPELCQAIRDNRDALLALLAGSAPEPEPSPPLPNDAACTGCWHRDRTMPAGRYWCARIGTWGHRHGCPPDLPGVPPPSASDRESIAFALLLEDQK
jgi:hypothetical protein